MGPGRSRHICDACGAIALRWSGRCPACGEWNSLVEHAKPDARSTGDPGSAGFPGLTGLVGSVGSFGSRDSSGLLAATIGQLGSNGRAGLRPPTAMVLSDVDPREAVPRKTGLPELDRVLGGGLVPGSVTLLAGEPGVGKSTLLLQALTSRANMGGPVLLVAAEESAQQVRLRAERLGPLPDGLLVLSSTDVMAVVEAVSTTGADLVVVDSIQAVSLPDVAGPPGSLAQVRACSELLVSLAQAHRASVVLVGHVTKQGTLAGPRSLEHLVDTVLTVDGDRHHALRMVRAVKHRFGPTGELGLFEMGEGGLAEVSDPYRLLLGDRHPEATGSAVLPAVEGERAIVVELQALVSHANGGSPRRTVRGLEPGRIGLLLAVLDQRCGVRLARSDVYCSVAGGMKVSEPAADLPMAMALVSAATGVPVPPELFSFGEVGLAGEVRQVPHALRRLTEARRLGFRHAVVPSSTPACAPGLELFRVDAVADAVNLVVRSQARAGHGFRVAGA